MKADNMKHAPWARGYAAVCGAAFAGILLLLPVHAFISTWGGTAIGPLLLWKSWKEILLALLVPVVAAYCILRPDVAQLLWARLVNKLIVAYVLLSFLLAVFSQASADAVIGGLLMNLRFFAMFVLAQVVMASNHPWAQRARLWSDQWLLWVGIGLSVFAILQVTVLPKDFFTHFGYERNVTIAPVTVVDSNPNVLRAFATMRGPNTLGAYVLMPIGFALYYLYARRKVVLAGVTLILSIIALMLTGSRSAWLGCAAMVLVLAALLLPRLQLIKWSKRLAIPVIALCILLGWAALTVPSIRLAIFHSSQGDSSLTEGSTDAHWAAALHGIAAIIKHPLGTGIGSAGPASFYNTKPQPVIAEDYFVQIGQEVGVLGLSLFLAISTLVARDLWRAKNPTALVLLASFVGLNLINLFLHGWADDPTAMTWWGLAGLFIANRKD